MSDDRPGREWKDAFDWARCHGASFSEAIHQANEFIAWTLEQAERAAFDPDGRYKR